MNIVVKLLVGKLIEVLVKYAEKKFTEAKQGKTKKAYVLKKVDEAFDVNEDGVNSIKEELAGYIDEEIEETVRKFKK